MKKPEMINAIIGEAKNSAITANRPFDGGDLFFTLAFRSEKELRKICKSIGINA